MQRVWCVTVLALGIAVLSGLKVSTTDAIPAILEPAAKAAAQLPRLHSLLVSQRGTIRLERYFNGRRATTPANVKSVSKSVIAALVGIASDRKLLSLSDPIGKYFPDLTEAGKRAITVEDLLTMRSGLESTSSRNYGAWIQSANWIRHALAKPLLAAPGTQMIYSTGNSHLLSAILAKAVGKSTLAFAQEVLAKPLGFSLSPWMRDPQGNYFGGNEMVMTPLQMLAFGEMYRNGGQMNGRQILSKAFIEDTFEPRGRSRISGREYGYGWWMREMAGRNAYYAWGFGGQYIVLVPSLDLTVVSTSAASVSEDRRDHRRTVDEIIEQLIVGALGNGQH
jgi:CubicO group peptidase (beta-lactamase class C family)